MARRARSPSFLITVSIVLAVLLLLAGAFGLRVLWSARQAIQESALAAGNAHRLGVQISPLRASHSRFESLFTPAEFQSAAPFAGDLYVAGRGALFRFSNAALQRTWRVGADLPPFPLGAICVRAAAGSRELWIGTDGGGVLVYDGAIFRQILPAAETARHISALLPLGNGKVLIGTRTAGVYTSDGQSFESFHPQFADAQVTVLAGDDDGLWIGTRADGVWLWRGGEALHFENELPDPQVLSVATSANRAWIGTALGVTEFVDGKATRQLADGLFAQALAERNGRLWIGTVDQGLWALPLEEHKPRPQLADHRDATGPAVEAFSANAGSAAEGDLLAVTANEVFRLPDRAPAATAPNTMLRSGHVSALNTDDRGRLWIGYFDAGLDIVDPTGRITTQSFDDDVLFCVNRIKQANQGGETAVATANGLALFDASAHLRQVLDRSSGLIASNVTDVQFEDQFEHQGSGPEAMTIATPAGISFVENGAITSVSAFQGLINNHVYTLAHSGERLYAGTLGGLTLLRQGRVEASFDTANSQFRQNWITASAAWDGAVYLGTYGSGVTQLREDGALRSYQAFQSGRFEINPNALLGTGRALYAGTAGQGLAILRRGDERWQFVQDGLPSSNVTALAERSGELVVGTDNGVVRASEKDLLPE